MTTPLHIDLAQYPVRIRWFMVIAWGLIGLKCSLIWWAIDRWHVPFHPLWIVGPTLAFAALATVIWLTHHRD